MATSSISSHRPIGQTQPGAPPAHPLTIQQTITALRRQLADTDAAFVRLLAERRELEAALLAERQRYADALGVDRLREQGAGAVEAAVEVWGLG